MGILRRTLREWKAYLQDRYPRLVKALQCLKSIAYRLQTGTHKAPLQVRPRALRLESMLACQLRCPACPTTQGLVQKVAGTGYLTLDDFRRLITDNPSVRCIELSNYGEMFLNPELLDIIKLAAERQVTLTADNGVNLNTATEKVLEGLVQHGFRSLLCSIDGASEETYARYRVRGSLAAVMQNIRTINRFKRQYRSAFPELTWQFVIFGHNEHELPAARHMAHELGMAFHPKLSWDADLSPVRDDAYVNKGLTDAKYSTCIKLSRIGLTTMSCELE